MLGLQKEAVPSRVIPDGVDRNLTLAGGQTIVDDWNDGRFASAGAAGDDVDTPLLETDEAWAMNLNLWPDNELDQLKLH